MLERDYKIDEAIQMLEKYERMILYYRFNWLGLLFSG